jgi:FtsH-binding integral membrane protein
MTGPSPQDAQPDTRASLDRLTNDTLRRVAVCIAGALVTTGVVLAATNTGSEQHTWWGWLLIGAPLTWLSFIAMVALTFGVLRIIIATRRSPLSRSATRHAITNTMKFLRAGYPQGVPTTDTFPLLAVLPRTAIR